MFRAALLTAGSLLAYGPVATAEHVVVKGTTVTQTVTLNFLSSTGVSARTTDSTKLQQFAVYSSLGGLAYAYYILNTSAKQAYKSTGLFAKGPTLFSNFSGSGRSYEVHKQFNKKWSDDIPLLGDNQDLWNQKTGTLEGPRSLIRLPQAGFSIQAAPKLAGFHTHTVCSDEFGIDPAASAGYSAGNFFQVHSSRSNFRLDTPLTDQANAAGGSLANAMAAVEGYLSTRQYAIIPVAPLPF